MKTIAVVRYAAIVVFASAPLFAHAAENDSVQRCMNAFASQNFSDRNVSFAIENDNSVRLPLIANSGTRHVQVIASERVSGRVLATANCQFRGNVLGEVTVAAPIVR
jgi:hypothetical protein